MFALFLAAAIPAVAIGRPQRVGRVVVTPVRIEEDSRCPMNARCIWAGRVTVSAAVRDGRRRTTRLFTLGAPERGIVLDSVTPERTAGARAPARRYRFHFAPAP